MVAFEEKQASASENAEQDLRAPRVLARLRHRQLQAAKQGRVVDSWRYARRADRVRRATTQDGVETISM